MEINKIRLSNLIGNRLDVTYYNNRFDYKSNSYPVYELGRLMCLNPNVSLSHLTEGDKISFIPMEAINEIDGYVSKLTTIPVSESKGYTKFRTGDLLWAKITPCMQNGKSAIVPELENGLGCGSTEFYVLRPKRNDILTEYVHFILRDKRILQSAINSFGGSAGQQRVPSSFLKTIKIPLPPISVQQEIVDINKSALKCKQRKEQKAQFILDSINEYVLKRLGITLPCKESVENKCNIIYVSQLINKRFDPYYHQEYFVQAFKQLTETSLYPLKSLSEISELITSGITPKSGGDDYTDAENGIAFIRSGDIDIMGNVDFDNLLYIKEKIHNTRMKSSQVKDGDIMIAIVGATIGQVGIYHSTREANINQAIALVRLKKGYNPEYIKEVIKSSIGQLNLDRLKRPVARANINLDEVASILIPVPEDIEIQNEIVKEIQSIRKKAKQLQEEGAKLLEEAKQKIEQIILG